MKKMMRSGNRMSKGISLLLMLSLLITLLPTSIAAAATVGAYGSVTVTTKNVVIRATAAGARTGFFAQKGTYPMIGPVETVDGVAWYNIQTSETAGFVSGLYATASYGSAGMPSFDKKYVNIVADLVAYTGAATAGYDHTLAGGHQVPIAAATNPILQLDTGVSYTVDGVAYIDLYYNNALHHTEYTNAIANYIMTVDNVNDYIYNNVWPAYATAATRQKPAKGDILTHAIQTALNVLGYFSDAIDASFGDMTETAVKNFQTKNSLSADGIVGATTYAKLFPQAIAEVNLRRANYGLGTTPGGTTTVSMIQTTIKNLRLRKSYSTSSAYVGVVPVAGTILTYTRTQTNGSTTWYYVQYNGVYGWVMGTYVTAYTAPTGGSSGGTTTPTISNWGTVKITKKLTAIRVTANGKRTGYSVNTGDVCTMIGPSVTAGGYTWYHIRTQNGREGFVRGDCATASFGSAGMPDSTKSYVQFLYDNMKINLGSDPAVLGPEVTLPKGTVLQLVNGIPYTVATVEYINVYYRNNVYNVKYTNAVAEGLMSQDNTNNYISSVLWARTLDNATEIVGKAADGGMLYQSDICVQAVQAALYQLGLYSDKMDGICGDKTSAAIQKFRKTLTGVTETPALVGSSVSAELFAQATAALQAKLTAASGTDTGDGTVPAAGAFGTVNVVKKGSWAEIDGGSTSLFPKGSTITVMSVMTKQVFRLYRWSGANHADCVPYDTSDTATLCSILGVTYNSASPSSSELASVKGAGNDDWPSYTWPKFRWDNITKINDSDGKIPVWVNINGTVYCASIYVIPHGYTGTSSFSLSKLGGKMYYERNNMYGMLCVHFYGSTTHTSGTVNADHMANINYAYNNAAAYFGASKVK